MELAPLQNTCRRIACKWLHYLHPNYSPRSAQNPPNSRDVTLTVVSPVNHFGYSIRISFDTYRCGIWRGGKRNDVTLRSVHHDENYQTGRGCVNTRGPEFIAGAILPSATDGSTHYLRNVSRHYGLSPGRRSFRYPSTVRLSVVREIAFSTPLTFRPRSPCCKPCTYARPSSHSVDFP